jgi:hypothetical protein
VAEKTRGGENRIDSFEELLRQQPASHVSWRSLLASGQKLAGGRLEILHRIGEGGMGFVYDAFDAERRSKVALKTLSRLDAANIYRLKNEFRALAEVSHPNLVRLHELFSDDAHWFFTMDLVRGVRFDQWVRPSSPSDGLDEGRLRSAMQQLVGAVMAIHDAGKLHRDLKPSNVLVTEDGRVVVLDFGLAVDPELGGVGQTVPDQSVSGTPQYMAPEQAAGQPAMAASDLYAIGVMLFEALTGKLPFDGGPHEVVMVAKQTREAPPARQFRPDVPEDLASLCAALLARDPAARPDAASVAARLGGAAPVRQDAPARSGPASMGEALLGRDAELAQLRSAYEATLSGQSVMMFVSGESGMGKSALVDALLSELRDQGHAAVLAGRCYERESLPFKGFDSLVDDLSRFLRRLPHAEAMALMPREVFALARLFPVLDRVDAVASAPKKEVPDPQELRRRAFAALGELFGRIRDRRPLVLYVDDGQWLDHDSVAFARALLVQIPPVPGLAIISHRSEGAEQNELLQSVIDAAKGNSMIDVRSVRVGPLGAEAAQELAKRWSGTADTALARSVAQEAGGSPFFVAELARHAARAQGRASLTHVSIASALAERLDELSAESRRLLEVTALAGSPLPTQVLIDAARSTHAALDALRAVHLVRTSGGEALEAVECYHDRIRETVAGALSDAACAERYAWLAPVLEQRPDADAELLARCFEGAAQAELAAVHAERAGDKAVGATAFEHAASLYAKAMALGGQLPAARHVLAIKSADALAEAGRGREAAALYQQCAAETTGAESIDLRRKAAEQLVTCGHMSEGEALLRGVFKEVGLAIPSTPGRAIASLAFTQLRIRFMRFDFEPRASSDVSALARLRLDCQFSAVKSLSGNAPVVSAAVADRWLLDAARAGDRDHIARALAALIFHHSIASPQDEPRIAEIAAAAEQCMDEKTHPAVRGYVWVNMAIAEAFRGRWSAARRGLARALEFLRGECRGVNIEIDGAVVLDLVCAFQRGDFADIARTTPAAIEEALRRDRILAGGDLSGCFGLPAHLAHDDVEGARKQLERARSRWEPGSEMLMADCLLWLGEGQHALYRGDAAVAFEQLERRERAFRRSAVASAGFLRVFVHAVRGGVALASLRASPGGRELRQTARRCAQALQRERMPHASPHAQTIDAGLALAEGRDDDAIPLLRASVQGFDRCEMKAYAAAARRRLGQLVGGDEGTAFVAEGDAILRQEGVKNLEAMTEMLVPGCRGR